MHQGSQPLLLPSVTPLVPSNPDTHYLMDETNFVKSLRMIKDSRTQWWDVDSGLQAFLYPLPKNTINMGNIKNRRGKRTE